MNAEPPIHNFTISVDRIHAIAQTGIHRACMFTRMAVTAKFSASDINDIKKGKFGGFSPFGPIQEDRLTNLTENFHDWIMLNAVREIVESFYLYIDELLYALEILRLQQTQKITWGDHLSVTKNIKEKPVRFEHKLQKLINDHSISISEESLSYIRFMEQIRHCASHNRGIVDPRHFTHRGSGENTARLEWLTFALSSTSPAGKKRKLKQGSFIEANSVVSIEVKKSVKEVPYGSYLKLTWEEIEWISLTMFSLIQNITQQANAVLQSYNLADNSEET